MSRSSKRPDPKPPTASELASEESEALAWARAWGMETQNAVQMHHRVLAVIARINREERRPAIAVEVARELSITTARVSQHVQYLGSERVRRVAKGHYVARPPA